MRTHVTRSTLAALLILGLLGSTTAGFAQEPVKDLVPFKATLTVPLSPFFVIPVTPPVASVNWTAPGQSDLLGAVNAIYHAMIHFNAEGVPVRETDGIMVLTAANGDALHITNSGLLRVTATSFTGEQVFTITGGKGRFLGAAGSGSWRGTVDTAKNTATLAIEGVVSRPKP
jgi:hypothetical protein